MVKHYKNYISIFLFANLLLSQASLSSETQQADSVKIPLESKTLILSSNVIFGFLDFVSILHRQ